MVASADGKHTSTLLRGSPATKRDRGVSYSQASWSGDGRCVAFVYSDWGGELMPYFEMDVKRGSKPVHIAWQPMQAAASVSPAWSPDGRRLVFVAAAHLEGDLGGGLFIDTVGTDRQVALTPITEGDGQTIDDQPAWSPDGKTIAFSRTRYEGLQTRPPELYLIQPNRSGLHRLAGVTGRSPSWSPDGKHIVFDTGRRIAVIDRDGHGLRYLTAPADGKVDSDPAWAPDGRSIAFVRSSSTPSAHGDLWLMSPAGGRQRLFIRNGMHPAWKPQS